MNERSGKKYVRDLVSVVVPCFNQAGYLAACLDRCIFQTYPYLEIIVVDGGSNDRTKDILNAYPEEIRNASIDPVSHMDDSGHVIRKQKAVYPRNRELTIVSFDEDIGATRTYNEGFMRVRGEYCTYIVGDDLPHPHMIEELVFSIKDTGADFAYSDMDVVDDGGRIIRQMRLPDYSFNACLAQWYHLGVSHLYKTELHDHVGLMDEKGYAAANDYDHYLRFAMHGARFAHVPKILYSIRYHGENRKTGQHTDERYKTLIEESRTCAMRARAFMEKRNQR